MKLGLSIYSCLKAAFISGCLILYFHSITSYSSESLTLHGWVPPPCNVIFLGDNAVGKSCDHLIGYQIHLTYAGQGGITLLNESRLNIPASLRPLERSVFYSLQREVFIAYPEVIVFLNIYAK